MPKAKAKKEDFQKKTPKSVSKQGAQADKMLAKLAAGEDPYGKDKPVDPVVEPADPPAEPAPVPAEPAVADPPAAPAADPKPAAPVQKFEPGMANVTPAQDGGEWQHKYQVLEGKYNSEMQRLEIVLQNQDALMKTMQQTIESLQAGQAPAAAAAPAASVNKIDPKLFDTYGTEMVELATGFNSLIEENAALKAQIASAPAAAQSSEGFDEVKGRVDNIEAGMMISKKDQYYDALDRAVPTWEQINVTPAFNQFLDTTNPIYNATYRQIMAHAHKNLDARQVSAVFFEFNRVSGITPEPGSTVVPDNDSLAAEAVPTPAGGAQSPEDLTGKQADVITVEMLKDAKMKVIRGQLTEAEYDKLVASYQRQLKALQEKQGKR